MLASIALYNVAPFQMSLFKEAHPKCVHVPIFYCPETEEVWPTPFEGWDICDDGKGGKEAIYRIPIDWSGMTRPNGRAASRG